jgi:phasin family protein
MTPRPEATPAAAAIEAAPAAPALPPPQPALARTGNLAAMPSPVALFDAFAHGAEAYADEMAGLAQTGFANATDTAKAMLGAKTLTEAFEINAGFFRKSLDTILSGSMRLSDIAARLTEETLQPLMPAR